jgi:uncharacterized OB-fold protein
VTPAATIERYRTAAAASALLVQRCSSCHLYVHYPRIVCPHCRGLDLEWREACGRATVYSFSIVSQPPSERWKNRVPYVLAIVELEEGPRMMSNIVGCDVDEVRCGMAVTVTFERRDGRVLPQFRPADRQAS